MNIKSKLSMCPVCISIQETLQGALHLTRLKERIYDLYLLPYGLTQCFEIEYIPRTILTNGETKDFNFVKSSNSNHRLLYDTTDYELPIDYRSEKSDSISELRDDITNKIEQSLALIKPIDTNQLREIINTHYQKR